VSPAERSKAVRICNLGLAAHEKPLLDDRTTYDSAVEIRAEIDVAVRWAASRRIIAVVIEFGDRGAGAAQHLRAAWRCAVGTALETRSFGWTGLALGGESDVGGELSRSSGFDRLVGGSVGLCNRKSALGNQ